MEDAPSLGRRMRQQEIPLRNSDFGRVVKRTGFQKWSEERFYFAYLWPILGIKDTPLTRLERSVDGPESGIYARARGLG